MPPIDEVLKVDQLAEDVFQGKSFDTSMQRTFGGQVAAQSLVAAVRTVREDVRVHSLHGYFLRPGDPDAPTELHVDRVRDGRSFLTRRVTAIQHDKAIFSMSASFHAHDDGPEHQDDMPRVPGPDNLSALGGVNEAINDWFRQEWPDWDIRIVPAVDMSTSRGLAAQQRVWIRYRHELPPDPVFHVCVLAYMSDMTLLGSARVPHPDAHTQGASLDHALWFLRPFRADEWLLYDQTSPSAGFGRALTQGRIFDQGGNMVAAVVQEGLMRYAR
ncbi:acyl-CoA thioesterase II [Rhodococcus sp. X156]|uniref:acyl-CoA thioesterase n=1 Tax=Rhodococcus sp. X156 TaxID=2499145 RepID=UPI000FD91A2D|nr:acyl-CoA thioesterase II [Rhodococcus sp. X156]